MELLYQNEKLNTRYISQNGKYKFFGMIYTGQINKSIFATGVHMPIREGGMKGKIVYRIGRPLWAMFARQKI